MKKQVLAVFTIMFFAGQAQARHFYKTAVYIGLDYASIETGSTNVFMHRMQEIRYSDDAVFCFVSVDSVKYKCEIDGFYNDNKQFPKIMINDEIIQALFTTNIRTSNASVGVQEAFSRLKDQLPQELLLDYTHDRIWQLHDDEPESFHAKVFDLDSGERI